MCPDVTAASTPPSGSAFNVGTTTVNSTATSQSVPGSASCSFTVSVKDAENPLISCPGPQVIDATSPLGVLVTFAPVAADNCSVASLTSVPASGTVFPIGDTTVTSTAVDASGNQSSCSFSVHVKGAAEQTNDLITAVNNLSGKAGIKNALLAKLNAALAKLQSNNTAAACGPLKAFINLVTAMRGKDISISDADALIAAATNIRAVIGCVN